MSAASEWLYYKHFPWVYDNVTEDWLYLHGASDGKIYAYRNSSKSWEEFSVPELTWEQKYEDWVLDPAPYGGLSVLQEIKDAKDSGSTELDLHGIRGTIISDLSPLEKLTNLTQLILGMSWNIVDLSPLAELTNLTKLDLYKGQISDLTPLAGLTNLTYLDLRDNNVTDLSPLENLTNLTWLDLSSNKITDYSALAKLTQLTELSLGGSGRSDPSANIVDLADLHPLKQLTNLTKLSLWYVSHSSDFSQLAELSDLTELTLHVSDGVSVSYELSVAQKAIIEEALPNTTITYW